MNINIKKKKKKKKKQYELIINKKFSRYIEFFKNINIFK